MAMHWDITATTQDGRPVAGAIWTIGDVSASECIEAFKAADTAAIVTLSSRLRWETFKATPAEVQAPRGEQRVWEIPEGR